MTDPGLLELEVGAPGHGGFCIARADGRVVFVRHALPGERIRAWVTEDGGSYLRADAVEVLQASADRVPPPCPHARPGRCGGCDWQHASGPAQRRIKAAVVREQFARLADVQLDLEAVEELPGGLLGWRTRITYALGRDATVGLHKHRSHELEPVGHCPLGLAAVADPRPAPAGAAAIEAVVDDDGAVAVVAHRPGSGRQARGRRPPDRLELVAGPQRLRHRLGHRLLEVAATGFWQVHPQALATFAAAVRAAAQLQPGDVVLDLYAGAGPLTTVLAEVVGPRGRVVGIESARTAVADAERNLADQPWAEVRAGRIDAALIERVDIRPDVVVLDPPRAGAGTATMRSLLALSPRRIVYLSCDPATLARDARAALDAGWSLAAVRAFDAFPMTHHVECLATLVPGDNGPADDRIGDAEAGTP